MTKGPSEVAALLLPRLRMIPVAAMMTRGAPALLTGDGGEELADW